MHSIYYALRNERAKYLRTRTRRAGTRAFGLLLRTKGYGFTGGGSVFNWTRHDAQCQRRYALRALTIFIAYAHGFTCARGRDTTRNMINGLGNYDNHRGRLCAGDVFRFDIHYFPERRRQAGRAVVGTPLFDERPPISAALSPHACKSIIITIININANDESRSTAGFGSKANFILSGRKSPERTFFAVPNVVFDVRSAWKNLLLSVHLRGDHECFVYVSIVNGFTIEARAYTSKRLRRPFCPSLPRILRRPDP